MVDRRISTLSYGERARLMLAILVLQSANLLVLDEPLNHLDLAAREEFEQALEGFEGTMLLVLHDRFAIERLATRVVEVRDGRVAALAGELATMTCPDRLTSQWNPAPLFLKPSAPDLQKDHRG